ncbi:unnamed protein product [Dibothriocephalus latus]|uniref:Uncharacterized protein n=1 Tax=Dibothriocephalus latus TaxID=60516 RepID=A0A3P7PII6_DIBLA|nr:unnamed protein product [Dibothriocephalus latus]
MGQQQFANSGGGACGDDDPLFRIQEVELFGPGGLVRGPVVPQSAKMCAIISVMMIAFDIQKVELLGPTARRTGSRTHCATKCQDVCGNMIADTTEL